MPGQHSPISSAESGAVVTKAAIRAADQLKINAEALAAIIGVNEATISHSRSGGSVLEPGTKPFELAVLFVQLFRSLDAIVGGDVELAAAWLVSPNITLDARPIEKLRTVAGLADVIAYLDARLSLEGSYRCQKTAGTLPLWEQPAWPSRPSDPRWRRAQRPQKRPQLSHDGFEIELARLGTG